MLILSFLLFVLFVALISPLIAFGPNRYWFDLKPVAYLTLAYLVTLRVVVLVPLWVIWKSASRCWDWAHKILPGVAYAALPPKKQTQLRLKFS